MTAAYVRGAMKQENVFHPALEGLRGAAVLFVCVYHAHPEWVSGGFLSISTFFALSGFLITRLLVREFDGTGTVNLKKFWTRRLRRLLPASLLALFAIAIGGGTLANPAQHERLAGDGFSALFYFSNWWLIATGAAYDNLMGSPSPVQHFWSLSIEEQFYLFYPLLTLSLLRAAGGSKRALCVFLAVASVASLAWMSWLAPTEASTARLYYATDTRVGELLLGGVLALVMGPQASTLGRKRPALFQALGVIGLAVFVAGNLVGDTDSVALYRFGFQLYAIGSVALLAAAVQETGIARQILSWSVFQWLGRISYGVYLYHWPLFIWIDADWLRFPLTFLAADLSYRFFEEPIRSGRAILHWRRFVLPPVAIVLVIITFGLTRPSRTLSAAAVAAIADISERSSPLKRKARIAIIGGSMAQEVGEGLDYWAERTGKAVVENMAVRGCGLARGSFSDNLNRPPVNCDDWHEEARARFAAFGPDAVVVFAAPWDLMQRRHADWSEDKAIGDPVFDAWLMAEFTAAIETILQSGAHVAWLTTPCYVDPAGKTTGAWDPQRLRRMNDVLVPALAEGRETQVSVIDFEQEICPGRRYSQSVLEMTYFRAGDGVHFSHAGRNWSGTWVGEELLRVVPFEEEERAARR